MTARQQALEFFIRQGWTPQQAAGIVANLEAESGLRPDAVGDGGQAYGIAQWHPDRQSNFAGIIGKPIQGSSLFYQMYFVHAELRGTEKHAGDALAACTTAAEAGACISRLYERPADREGEATKRAALAERIYADYGGTSEVAGAPPMPSPATPPPSDAAATLQQPEQSMPAILATLLPSVLQLFAPRAQAALGKLSGQPADVLNPFLQQLFQQIGQATGTGTVQTDAQAIAAAAALQKAPPEVVQAVESHALDYLDKIVPLFDKLAAADAAENAAAVARMNAASERASKDKWDMTPWLVWIAGGTATVLVLALLGAIIMQALTGDKKIDTALIGLAGPLLAIAMGVWREIFAYRFDGNPASNATAALRDSITAAEKK